MPRISVGLVNHLVKCLNGAKAGLDFVKGFMTSMAASFQVAALVA
jgi:hypothetical protein